MAKDSDITLNDMLQQDDAALLQSWIDAQVMSPTFRSDRTNRQELADHSRRFLTLFREALKSRDADIFGPAWSGVRQMLDELSTSRARDQVRRNSPGSATSWRCFSTSA